MKVLLLLVSESAPFPVLVMLPAPWMMPESTRLLRESPDVSKVRAEPPRFSAALMVGVVPKASLTAVMVPVGLSTVGIVTVVLVAETVAGAEIVMVVPLTMDATVAPIGMPVPVMGWPTARPADAETVMVLLPVTVVELAREKPVPAMVGLAVPPWLLRVMVPSIVLLAPA